MASGEARGQDVVFAGAVDGLFLRGLGSRVTPALREELKAIGLDLSRPLMPAYPRSLWNTSIALAAKHVWPDVDSHEAHLRVGRAIIDGFQETLLGKALAVVAKMLGPERTLGRMRHNFRTGGNYNEVTLTRESATCVLFWVNEPYLDPGYVQGMLEGSLVVSGAKQHAVTVLSRDDKGTTYRVSWE